MASGLKLVLPTTESPGPQHLLASEHRRGSPNILHFFLPVVTLLLKLLTRAVEGMFGPPRTLLKFQGPGFQAELPPCGVQVHSVLADFNFLFTRGLAVAAGRRGGKESLLGDSEGSSDTSQCS